MNIPSLQFDEENHTYKHFGKIVPGVTQIIGELLPMQFKCDDWYMTRGRAVHQCAAYIAKGIDFHYNHQIAGQVAAIRKFFAEVNPQILNIEERVYSIKQRYAGTYDLSAIIGKKHCLVDYKSSIDIERIGLQLGGYSAAMPEPCADYGIGVQLKEDGNYSMTQMINLKNYRREFLALRSVYAIRERLNLNTKPEVS